MSFFAPKKPERVILPPPEVRPIATPTKGGLFLDRRPKPQAEAPSRDEVVDGPPVGKIIVLKAGYFDSRGFWVTNTAQGVRVQRGAPPGINSLLSADQRRVLRAAQQKARKAGLR